MPFKLLTGAFYLNIPPSLIQVKGFFHFCVCIFPNLSLALFSNLVQLKYEEGAARLATPSHFIKQPGDLIVYVDDEEQ